MPFLSYACPFLVLFAYRMTHPTIPIQHVYDTYLIRVFHALAAFLISTLSPRRFRIELVPRLFLVPYAYPMPTENTRTDMTKDMHSIRIGDFLIVGVMLTSSQIEASAHVIRHMCL